jgi:tripeptide aminopeptidase
MKQEIIDLFLDLIKFDTTSAPDSDTYPSTETQSFYAEVLAGKLMSTSVKEINIDEYGYVTALLPSNCNDKRTVGFISHMDTSPDCSGYNIQASVVEHYDGSTIIRKGVPLSPEEFPELLQYKNKTLIISDGTTLLGADDKAGITEIITMLRYFNEHPEVKHCNIKVAFTPDEEIGAGVDHFNVESFGCDYAYTVDGGILGEISYENFNAARAKIDIKGKSVHPGSAKNVMLNAALIATEISSMLPSDETPSHTEGYDGFYHLTEISGNVENAHLNYIIRDFDKSSFEKRKELITDIVKEINKKYGDNTATLELYDEYYNMAEIINKHRDIVDLAVNAIKETGIEPVIEPIRGGTDGARLSFMGLPCPNLFTGGHNFHGPYEYICVESMEKAVETLINIAKTTAK